MTELLDEALLLTTELCTNGVIHAGTDLDIEIVADDGSLSVCVMDFRSGPLTDVRWATPHQKRPAAAGHSPNGGAEIEERGRGLLLVDQLASRWGTVHHPGGKGVWFRLDRPGGRRRDDDPPEQAVPAIPSTLASALAPPGAPTALGPAMLQLDGLEEFSQPTAALWSGEGLAETGAELLNRLCTAVGASGAALFIDQNDGRGEQVAARYGTLSSGAMRIALPLNRPWRGELALSRTPAPYARPLAELTAERIALFIENQRLRRSDSERRSWLTFLAEASELLAQSLDVNLTMALIPQLVVPRLGHWCAVHATEDGGELKLAAATHADEAEIPHLLSTLASALPQLREAQHTDAVMPLAAPVEGFAVGLVARGQKLGTLSVGRSLDHWQGPEEVAVVEDVARRAALAIDNARIHAERRGIAEALQRSLLPPRLPEVTGIDFGAEYVPTGGGVDVGGDFYDVVPLDDERWLVVVGDVSGKGVQAATVTGLVRDVTRVLIRDGRPLPEALARLNETLVERGGGRFCTLALALVEPAAGARLDVSLYLAGHDQPVLLHADGTTSLVGRCGTALGLLGTVSSPVNSFAMGPGDTLVFYTDGVTERRRGIEFFGVDRLCAEAAQLAGFPADVIAARLRAATLGFSHETPRDDIAIFTIRNDMAVEPIAIEAVA
jgi:serine phosphatase RsbU (regulator of sigma subunit)/anti-sigma regulatory factor (Ser/Thr protein kinase)